MREARGEGSHSGSWINFTQKRPLQMQWAFLCCQALPAPVKSAVPVKGEVTVTVNQ